MSSERRCPRCGGSLIHGHDEYTRLVWECLSCGKTETLPLPTLAGDGYADPAIQIDKTNWNIESRARRD